MTSISNHFIVHTLSLMRALCLILIISMPCHAEMEGLPEILEPESAACPAELLNLQDVPEPVRPQKTLLVWKGAALLAAVSTIGLGVYLYQTANTAPVPPTSEKGSKTITHTSTNTVDTEAELAEAIQTAHELDAKFQALFGTTPTISQAYVPSSPQQPQAGIAGSTSTQIPNSPPPGSPSSTPPSTNSNSPAPSEITDINNLKQLFFEHPASQAGWKGKKVTATLIVNPDGSVKDCLVEKSSGDTSADQAFKKATELWRFIPPQKDLKVTGVEYEF